MCMPKGTETFYTQKLVGSTSESGVPIAETPMPEPDAQHPAQTQIPQRSTPKLYRPLSKRANREVVEAQLLQEHCRSLCLSTFFCEHAPVRSLGFTSSLSGEGKTFLAMVTAGILADDSSKSVTLLECNWEHPCLHEHFGFLPTPGLAEWLRGECTETIIRHQVRYNLTFIPAGDGKQDVMKLLRYIRQRGLLNILGHSSGLLVVDLPALLPTASGLLAASLVESLVVVIRAGVTPDLLIAETCTKLKNLPVQGLILNQMESRIPRWIRQML